MGYIFKVQGEEETKKPKETKPTAKKKLEKEGEFQRTKRQVFQKNICLVLKIEQRKLLRLSELPKLTGKESLLI